MKRVYHHYTKLEEFHAGMWSIVRGEDRQRNIEAAATLMRNPESFRRAMLRATKEWPRSCEHNLTADGANYLAWLGHAGCCIAVQSSEENTRCAWHTLTVTEQRLANEAAAEVLAQWYAEVDLPLWSGI
jgi:hypothetical protein